MCTTTRHQAAKLSQPYGMSDILKVHNCVLLHFVSAICPGGCIANSLCVKPGVCRCRSGYTFNGDKCTLRHAKCAHPCLNGGVCKHGYCKCTQYYYGKMCQYGRTHALLISHNARKFQVATKLHSDKTFSQTTNSKEKMQNQLSKETNHLAVMHSYGFENR